MENIITKEEYNTVDEKVELIFEIINSITDENIHNIMFNSMAQGLNLIVSLFDENGEYKADKSKETIDTIEVFESFFNIKLDDLLLKYIQEHGTAGGDVQTDFVADSGITDFIEGDEEPKSDEELKADIKEKLNFINSVIDNA